MAASNISTWPSLDADGLTPTDKIAVHTSGALHAATDMDALANYNAVYGRFYGIDVANLGVTAALPSSGDPFQLTYDVIGTDTTAGWDGNAVWTCPRTGYWMVNSKIKFTELSMDGGNTDFLMTLGLYADSGLVEATGVDLNSRNLDVPDLGVTISVEAMVGMTAGQAITCGLMQNSGNTLNMTAEYSRFKVASLGAAD